jgi:hypothetical protein
MSLENINPNPSHNSNLGSSSASWGTGVFYDGIFANLVGIGSSDLSSPVVGELHYSKNGLPSEKIAFPADMPTNTSDVNNDSAYVGSDNVTGIIRMTQASYDALPTKDDLTLYLIVD